MNQEFITAIKEGYKTEQAAITLGAGMIGEEVFGDAKVVIPLSMMSRHGLISGATGTGKTKTLQKVVELLSDEGVPSMVMDMKGDLSGLAVASDGHPKIDERHTKIDLPWAGSSYPVEFLSISDEKGTKMRATISEFGSTLLSKILELNEVQSSILAMIFKYCDDQGLALLDIKDLKKALQYLTNEGKEDLEKEYGQISSSSVNTIMRSIVQLESQGGEAIFGERSFDVEDLVRANDEGKGYINILRLTDMHTKPKLFSTFMLCLLAEIYEKFPEEGDIEKPKLCLFIDEAHLVFDNASKPLLEQLEQIIKLIRSKGVGIYFITQNPTDIPAAILSQLGLKIQHALRAFTAKDNKAIKQAANNYPNSDFYETAEVLQLLGIGEAFVSALNEKGIPTPLVRVMLRAPQSRMDTISDEEIHSIISESSLVSKYNQEMDSESAYELLTAKIEKASKESESENTKEQSNKKSKDAKKEGSIMKSLSKNTMVRQLGRTVTREVTRGLLGILGVKR